MTHALLDIGFDGARLRNGALAGIAGGLLFGMMMQMMDMMGMIAMLVNSTSIAVGWIVHLVISAVFGIGLAAATRPQGFGAGGFAGLAWGIVLWVVAAMVVMRLAMGAPIAFDAPARMSLVGHMMYGLVAGLTLTALVRRAAADGEAAATRSAV